ncbi:uncharacterized protein LOC131025100 [Salvia miltiorrhiza]|uniref:uncharacterized protein LOC131025100 n=1 Tax=Salvia miltiorrhiza TaxID=226208 RepID=UPI0025AC7314|nr:uncharacterized protein LOC131025100 [Salvia miltiorrhiza]
MEAPPLSTAPPTTPTTTTTTPSAAAPYPDSAASSPRSRKHDSWDAEPPPPQAAKLRLMCSYGGHIVPRPHDKTLCYAGGDTRIIVIDRHTPLSDLHHRLSKTLLNNQPFFLKYQLPTEDLDSLITITSDEDLENMVEEYDRLHNAAAAKPGRLRLFLFPKSPTSIDQLLVQTTSSKPEDWFFNALNGKSGNLSTAASDRGFSDSSSVNNLLGLDDEFAGKAAEKDAELKIEASKVGGAANGTAHGNYVINQDVHSVPDSPMLDTTSSFGSASSSPSIPNLPRIKVHVEENRKVGGLGIEEQFQQISVNPPSQKQEEEEVFMSAGAAAGAAASPLPIVVGGEYRFISDDERSDHGGQRKLQQIQQAQLQSQQIPHFQQKQTNAFDLSSPHSVSSDGSGANQLYRQRQAIYHQEQLVQIQSGNSRTPSNPVDFNSVDQSNAKVQMQPQLQESGYVLSGQFDQIQPELHQPQQFIHAGNHYIPSNAVPIPSYYSVYPSQPQPHPHQAVLDQHYPVYYVPGTGRPNPPYNLPMQQPSYGELGQAAPSSHPQTAPVASQAAYNHARNVPSSKPEMVSGLYRTAATAAPQTVQVPASQAQYVGYPPIHHSSNPNYAYEFADPAHAQMYYTPLPPQLAAQYQTMKSAPAMAGKDASAPLSAEMVQHGSR